MSKTLDQALGKFSGTLEVDGTPVVDESLETDWISPTLLNGWESYGGSYMLVKYRRDANGFVQLSGLIRSGAQGSDMFRLPVGFRPGAVVIGAGCNSSTSNSTERVDIDPNGYVSQSTTQSTPWVSLDDIPSFHADA